MRRLCLLPLLLFLFLPACSSSRPQPATVLYNNKDVSEEYLQRALSAWSEVVPVVWKRAPRSRAQLVVRKASGAELRRNCQKICLGWSSAIGEEEEKSTIMVHELLQTREEIPLLTHEIGHFLGLVHDERGCSIMQTSHLTHMFCRQGKKTVPCPLSEKSKADLRRLYDLQSVPNSLRCFSKREEKQRMYFYNLAD